MLNSFFNQKLNTLNERMSSIDPSSHQPALFLIYAEILMSYFEVYWKVVSLMKLPLDNEFLPIFDKTIAVPD